MKKDFTLMDIEKAVRIEEIYSTEKLIAWKSLLKRLSVSRYFNQSYCKKQSNILSIVNNELKTRETK